MSYSNEMELSFDSKPSNEGFARVAVASFMMELNPTVEEVSDVKTAVSEAVTNAIIHAYPGEVRSIHIRCRIRQNQIEVEVRDEGCGIADVEKAMEPMYTTRQDLDRSGMGFSFMEAFMDELTVQSRVGEGTSVWMKKQIGRGQNAWNRRSD